jgi:hypothetical protein
MLTTMLTKVFPLTALGLAMALSACDQSGQEQAQTPSDAKNRHQQQQSEPAQPSQQTEPAQPSQQNAPAPAPETPPPPSSQP